VVWSEADQLRLALRRTLLWRRDEPCIAQQAARKTGAGADAAAAAAAAADAAAASLLAEIQAEAAATAAAAAAAQRKCVRFALHRHPHVQWWPADAPHVALRTRQKECEEGQGRGQKADAGGRAIARWRRRTRCNIRR
jgi:hypothetical protein